MEEEDHIIKSEKPPATIYYTAHNKIYINFNKALKSSLPILLYIYDVYIINFQTVYILFQFC